jgi:hypothetical protein
MPPERALELLADCQAAGRPGRKVFPLEAADLGPACSSGGENDVKHAIGESPSGVQDPAHFIDGVGLGLVW